MQNPNVMDVNHAAQTHPPAPLPAIDEALATLPAALERMEDVRHSLWQRVLAALVRAERCVTERFRVPPGGG